jgi:hypothetical protein
MNSLAHHLSQEEFLIYIKSIHERFPWELRGQALIRYRLLLGPRLN